MEGIISSVSANDIPVATAAKQTGLLDLSLDVLVHAMSFLQPGDIISASKVCKPLRACGSQRSVWMGALRRVCEQQRIFSPTFEPMVELSLLELKRAATSHLRLLAHFKRCSSKGYIPRVATRILENSDPASEAFENCMIIPGGRFLVTCARDIVQLWDLGINANSIIGCSAVASLKVGTEFIDAPVYCDVLAIHSTPDNQGLRLILAVDSNQVIHQYRRYDVCEIYPLRESEFRVVASACIERFLTSEEYWCTENEIVIHGETAFIVWCYVSDTWIRWESNLSVSCDQLQTCNDCIIVVADGSIAVFAMPALQPRVHNEPPSTISHKPMYRLSHRGEVAESYVLSNRRCGFAPPPDEISTFIDIIHNAGGSYVLDHYVLHRIDMPGSPLPHAFPVHASEIHMPRFELGDAVNSTWISPRATLMLYKTRSFLAARLCTLPTTEGGPVTQYPECQMFAAGEEAYGFDYCNFAGRVCIRDNIRSNEIRVIDYLP